MRQATLVGLCSALVVAAASVLLVLESGQSQRQQAPERTPSATSARTFAGSESQGAAPRYQPPAPAVVSPAAAQPARPGNMATTESRQPEVVQERETVALVLPNTVAPPPRKPVPEPAVGSCVEELDLYDSGFRRRFGEIQALPRQVNDAGVGERCELLGAYQRFVRSSMRRLESSCGSGPGAAERAAALSSILKNGSQVLDWLDSMKAELPRCPN